MAEPRLRAIRRPLAGAGDAGARPPRPAATAGAESQLDTLIHEMAHIEAWLLHNDGGHGDDWKRIARRVGCVDLACAGRGPRRRGRGQPPTDRVPDDLRRAA